MSKRLKRLLAFALSVMLLPVMPMLGVSAEYTMEGDLYTWDLKNIMDEIGYDEAEFQAGKAYEYHGLTITGNNDIAKIDEAGVKIGKVTSNNGQMNIAYTPPCPGKLAVTAAITKSGSYLSKIYVNTTLGKTGDAGNPIITDKTAAGTYTGETDLEAGNTYYIYDGSTATAHIESITFEPDLSQATASMTLNNTFSDNMLIQRDKPIILKGSYAFLESAEITLQNDNDVSDVQTATVDLSGLFSWRTELNAVSNYTDTYTLTITPSDDSIEPIEIQNIIFGDLYLCAGQSNMVVPASFYKGLGIDYILV